MILALLSSAVIQVTQPFPLPELTKECQLQPNIEACNAKPCAIQVCLPVASILAVAQDADERAKRNFVYNPNMVLDFRVQENVNTKWIGVCANLSLTTLELSAKAGIPENRLFRVLVKSAYTSKGPPTHEIGVVRTEDGQLWVIGDTTNLHSGAKLELLITKHYDIIDVSRMDQGNNWSEIVSGTPNAEALNELFNTD